MCEKQTTQPRRDDDAHCLNLQGKTYIKYSKDDEWTNTSLCIFNIIPVCVLISKMKKKKELGGSSPSLIIIIRRRIVDCVRDVRPGSTGNILFL